VPVVLKKHIPIEGIKLILDNLFSFCTINESLKNGVTDDLKSALYSSAEGSVLPAVLEKIDTPPLKPK